MDDGNVGQQILILVALIIATGFFAMTEMSIVSARKMRLEQKASEGHKGAKAALALANDPNRMFSTVQTGITLIGIITGLYGGATFSEPLSKFLKTTLPFLAPYADSISSLLIVTGITYFTIVVGELVPKRLAINSPETVAMFIGPPMRFFSILAKPFVFFLSTSSTIIIRLMGIQPKEADPVTEEEIKIMVSQGAAVGAFDEEEPELVDNVFRLGDSTVSDIMTPRTQLEWIDLDLEEEALRQTLIQSQHSRLPVGRESLDEVLGVINIPEIFARHLEATQPLTLHALITASMVEPLMVAESISLYKLLRLCRTEGAHSAVVLDEFGSVSGFVTLHDVMEEIVGLMPSTEEERREEENRIIPRGNHTWYVDGLIDVESFKEYFHIEAYLPGEENDLYKTIGGFVTYAIGRIPKETDTVTAGDYIFEVADMDNTRVDKIMLTYTKPETLQEEMDTLLDKPL